MSSGMCIGVDQQKGNCPVCRKVFDEKDIEHAHEYLEPDSSCMVCMSSRMN